MFLFITLVSLAFASTPVSTETECDWLAIGSALSICEEEPGSTDPAACQAAEERRIKCLGQGTPSEPVAAVAEQPPPEPVVEEVGWSPVPPSVVAQAERLPPPPDPRSVAIASPPVVQSKVVVNRPAPEPDTQPTAKKELPTFQTDFDPCGQFAQGGNAEVGSYDGMFVMRDSLIAVLHNDQPSPHNGAPSARREEMAAAPFTAYAVMVGGESLPMCSSPGAGDDLQPEIIQVSAGLDRLPTNARIRGKFKGVWIRHPDTGGRAHVSALIGTRDAKFVVPEAIGSFTVLKFVRMDGASTWRFVGSHVYGYNAYNGRVEAWLMDSDFR